MSRWVVLGSTGFIGSSLIRTLEALGEPVVGRSRANWSLDFLPSDHVVNCAGRLVGSQAELSAANVDLASEVASRAPASFVHLGSAAEYGPSAVSPVREDTPCAPVSPYGMSKWEGTQAVFAAHPSVLLVRPSNVVGPGMAPTSLLSRIRTTPSGGTLQVNRLDVIRDFVDVRDFCAALIHLVKLGLNGVYHVATGVGSSLPEVREGFLRAGHDVTLLERPVHEQVPEVTSFIADIAKLRATGFVTQYTLHQMVKSLFS